MSAVVAIRNATQMLTAEERHHITGLIANLKDKYKTLNSDARREEQATKAQDAKRTTLLKKIHEIVPDFTDEGQSYDDLKNLHDTAKSDLAAKKQQDKHRERLVKKWNDAGFDGDCPSMSNDALDAHIKSLLKQRQDEKTAQKKLDAQILADANKRQKIFDKVSELGLQPAPDSTLEQLQGLLTRHNDAQKQQKKDAAACKKFRNQLNKIIADYPLAGITDAPNDATPSILENAVIEARQLRDAYKKAQKELEKTQKANERAAKKLADEKKKSDDKAKKLLAKETGEKGPNKNKFFQLFTKYITQEIENGNIDSSLIDDAGGKGKYNSKKWAEMDDSQKKDPAAPWNLLSA